MKKVVKIQLLVATALLIVGGFFVYFIWQQLNDNSNGEIKNETESAEIFYKKLDGTKTIKDEEDLLPVAVMVENHLEARPQSGLAEASIVYEVLAEGGITRFLALYDLSKDIDRIGPVRSARPYYIDLAAEYGALYAHSGASPDAFDRLKTEQSVTNLDEFFGYNTDYFWRASDRYAPHNLYTSTERLKNAKTDLQLSDNNNLVSWKFKNGASQNSGEMLIKINYSDTSTHQVEWHYNPVSNRYERWQNQARHIDDAGNIIEADNIIVEYTKMKIIDEVGRKDIDLIGQGRVLVFRDGLAIEGQWQKESVDGRTEFFDNNGQIIELNRGQTWVQVVPDYFQIEY